MKVFFATAPGLIVIGTCSGLIALAFGASASAAWFIAISACAIVPLPFVLQYEKDHPDKFR